jgi:Ca2+-binding RTX toxin-like protein
MGSRRRRFGYSCGIAALGMLALAAASASAASTVTYSPSSGGSFLAVTGEADADLISIFVDGNTVTIADTGPGGIATADTDCSNVAGVVACPLDPPDPPPPAEPNFPLISASIFLAGGNDSFVPNNAPFFLSLGGGDGDDVITGGPRRDSMDGGSGNDQLFGGDGGDDLNGGGTAFTTGGSDLTDGQGGFDTSIFVRTTAVNVSLNDQPDDGFAGEGDNAIVERVLSGEGDDVLSGNPQANTLSGGGGSDLITGLEGNDFVDGGDGDDSLDGGPQRDQYDCDNDFDIALADGRDLVEAECERTGAEAAGGTASVNKKSKTKVGVSCPVEEANQCDGTVALLAGSKELGSADFSVGAGSSRRASVKLNKDGAKRLAKSNGTLLAMAEARTTEPIGTSVKSAEILLRTKKGGK